MQDLNAEIQNAITELIILGSQLVLVHLEFKGSHFNN